MSRRLRKPRDAEVLALPGVDRRMSRGGPPRLRRRRRACALVAATAWLLAAASSAAAECPPHLDHQYYVSNADTASNSNCGTKSKPFGSLKKGVAALHAGDTLNLRGGVYLEPLDVVGRLGTKHGRITIRSFPGESATVDGSLRQFRRLHNDDWEPASHFDEHAREDEYVSKATFTKGDLVNRGAFLDMKPYTRLITYSRLEDFRATNQTFEKIFDVAPSTSNSRLDPRPGFEEVVDKTAPTPYRYPWVYMGPGLWFDTSDDPETRGKVHIRLAHTTNDIPVLPGLPELRDYRGPTDPREVRLALSRESMLPLRVRGSRRVRLRNLTFRHGGALTASVENVRRVVFDHVRLKAATDGMRIGVANRVTLRGCAFSGGVPSWYFRSDTKAEYEFKDGATTGTDKLGKQTSLVLLLPNNKSKRLRVHHSEFVDGHDVYLGGSNIDFRRNWIHNLNDDALVLDAVPTSNVRIHHNIITQVVSALSFASDSVGGTRYVYRNVIDLRTPASGHRPDDDWDTEVWRYGQLFKSNRPDGPWNLFQNTFLVKSQTGDASFLHYSNIRDPARRRTLNNIFVAVNPTSDSDQAITLVPPPTFPGRLDGNDYHRIGLTSADPYRYLPDDGDDQTFGTLFELVHSPLFQGSGFEEHSREDDPQFRSMSADGSVRADDDLRLSSSPIKGHGVPLRGRLRKLDRSAPAVRKPDPGAYQSGTRQLRVGVDGRRGLG